MPLDRATARLVRAIENRNLLEALEAIREEADVNRNISYKPYTESIVTSVVTGGIGLGIREIHLRRKSTKNVQELQYDDTMLHLAVRKLQGDEDDPSFQIVLALVLAGADVDCTNYYREKPLDIIPSDFQSKNIAKAILSGDIENDLEDFAQQEVLHVSEYFQERLEVRHTERTTMRNT